MHISNAKLATNTSKRTAYLDKVIPLEGASHRDAVYYSAETPMRYTQCMATLIDGRKVRLVNTRQFIGWSDANGRRSYLFANGCRRIEILTQADPTGERNRRSGDLEVFSWPSLMLGSRDLLISKRNKSHTVGETRERSFVARDGSLLIVRGWAQLLAGRIGNLRPIHMGYEYRHGEIAGDLHS
jgi:hypothetical protein